jgi:hypothetical protein
MRRKKGQTQGVSSQEQIAKATSEAKQEQWLEHHGDDPDSDEAQADWEALGFPAGEKP